MEFIKQHIEGVWVIQPKRFGDARGYFSETFKLEEFRKHVGDVEFVQDNESFSTYGVLRGLHFQKGEFSQANLCACRAAGCSTWRWICEAAVPLTVSMWLWNSRQRRATNSSFHVGLPTVSWCSPMRRNFSIK